MRTLYFSALITVVFCFGLAVGVEAGKNDRVRPEMYLDQEPDTAADRLLEVALGQAGKGSWERIAVAEVHYLRGEKEKAEAIFDGIVKKEPGDWIRIGRIYQRAEDWDRAHEAFEQVLEMAPKDEDWAAEIGAFYNLRGDRKRAEELFDRSFAMDDNNVRNTLKAAGSYVGVQKR